MDFIDRLRETSKRIPAQREHTAHRSVVNHLQVATVALGVVMMLPASARGQQEAAPNPQSQQGTPFAGGVQLFVGAGGGVQFFTAGALDESLTQTNAGLDLEFFVGWRINELFGIDIGYSGVVFANEIVPLVHAWTHEGSLRFTFNFLQPSMEWTAFVGPGIGLVQGTITLPTGDTDYSASAERWGIVGTAGVASRWFWGRGWIWGVELSVSYFYLPIEDYGVDASMDIWRCVLTAYIGHRWGRPYPAQDPTTAYPLSGYYQYP